MKKLSFLLLFFITVFSVSGQALENPRVMRPFSFKVGPSFNAYSLSDTYFRVSASWFVNPHVELEASSGIPSIFLAGANYHFNSQQSRSAFSPFVGASIGMFHRYGCIAFPVGVNVLTNRGFTVSAAISNHLINGRTIDVEPYISLSIGWAFKK
jgi:hypothetical protein